MALMTIWNSLVAVDHGAQHLVFGQLFGFGFDHQHGACGTGNHQIQSALFSCSWWSGSARTGRSM